MQLLPGDPLALLALAAMVGGTLFVALSQWPKAYSLGLLILVVFGFQYYSAAFGRGILDPFTGEGAWDPIVAWLGFRAAPFLSLDAWWSPFSYMFVHSGLAHLIGNLFILLTAGPVLEDRVGPKAFLGIYFGAGAAAAGVHLLLATVGPEPRFVGEFVPAVGASGAIFGVLTAVAVLYPKEKLPLTPGFIMFVIWLPSVLVLGFYVVLNLALMYIDITAPAHLRSGTAWYGHFAGLAAGLVGAVILTKLRPEGLLPSKDGVEPVGPPRPLDTTALAPLAKTPELREMLGKIEGLQGATRDDAAFRDAWLDRFFSRARCPQSGDPLTRKGTVATCEKCGWRVDFAGKVAKKGWL